MPWSSTTSTIELCSTLPSVCTFDVTRNACSAVASWAAFVGRRTWASGTKYRTNLRKTGGVSRFGSTVTNARSTRAASDPSRFRAALIAASVVGQMSGQVV